MREGQGGALGEECEDLALQSSVRGEEAKMVEYFADGDLLAEGTAHLYTSPLSPE
jgi:hypothetical protein